MISSDSESENKWISMLKSNGKRMEFTPATPKGVDKVERYKWTTTDEPGEMMMIQKDLLRIPPEYQRDVMPERVAAITSAWSWMALGALAVALRDGKYWVMDGQHRLLASKRRSDIDILPCVVFKTDNIKAEAQGFLNLNAGRKPISTIGKQRALVAAEDETAAFVQSQFNLLGISVKAGVAGPRTIKALGWCWRRAAEDKDAFRDVLIFCEEIATKDEMALPEKLLEGVWILNKKCGEGLRDKRLAKRLRDVGARNLFNATLKAAAYYTSGGGKVWAQGMLGEINKGLRQKFEVEGMEA